MPSLTVNVDIKDNTHLEEQLPQLQSNIVHLSGKKMEQLLTDNSPYDTGHLQGSWRSNTSKDNVHFINSAEYARWVNDGRGPVHLKPGSKAKALKFTKGGQVIGFAKSAKATKGQKFVEKSIDEMEGSLKDIVSQAMSKL